MDRDAIQKLRIDPKLIVELREFANRKGRSISWLLRYAWRLAKEDIAEYPTAQQPFGAAAGRSRRPVK